MKSYFYHLQVNIDPKNLGFYKKFMSFLDWKVIFENNDLAGFKNDGESSLWFVKGIKQERGDYDKFGVNHIGLGVKEQEDVDKVCEYLKKENIKALFDTPRHRAEFAMSAKETYYQVMFESPDGVLFEVVYTGMKK